MTASVKERAKKSVKRNVKGVPPRGTDFPLALLCDPGCEDVAALEVKELIGKEAETRKGFVSFTGGVEDAATLLYQSQSAARLLALIATGGVTAPEEVVNVPELLTFDYTPFLPIGGSFRVTCEREGIHPFQSHDVEEALGAFLHDRKGWPVDLKKPAMTLFCSVMDDFYLFGVDLAGRDLGKREYKAYHTRRSLRATIAYAAVRVAGFSGTGSLVDPLCTDGQGVIEAALLATRMPVRRFRKGFALLSFPVAQGQDWDRFFAALDAGATAGEASLTGYSTLVASLKLARGNAKLAGIERAVTLSKCEVSWLDTKFDESSVDWLVTVPPCSGKNTPLKDVEKLQDDLFYQAKYVLTPNGRMLLVTEKKAEFLNPAVRHGFSLGAERKVRMGGKELLFLTFGKRKEGRL